MKRRINTYQKGFTLLEILLVIGIMGVIAVFTIAISHSIRNMTKVNDTRSRMEQIVAKAKEFYRNSGNLPGPGGTTTSTTYGTTDIDMGEVPVQTSSLNLEQKFRLDAWGQYLLFHIATFTASGDTDIDGINVDGNGAAGIIISLGPNQTQDYITSGGPTPPAVIDYETRGDDILLPINVSQEAGEVALEELKELQSKVKAIDALYEGIDNNSSGAPDETGCTAASPTTATGCPPTTLTGSGNNDPNCGTATLDYIEQNNNSYTCGNVTSNRALTAVINLYALANPQYRLDPWGNPYQWGCGTVCTSPYVPCDKQYHKFFSMGPDQTAGTKGTAPPCVPGTPGDDIIP